MSRTGVGVGAKLEFSMSVYLEILLILALAGLAQQVFMFSLYHVLHRWSWAMERAEQCGAGRTVASAMAILGTLASLWVGFAAGGRGEWHLVASGVVGIVLSSVMTCVWWDVTFLKEFAAYRERMRAEPISVFENAGQLET